MVRLAPLPGRPEHRSQAIRAIGSAHPNAAVGRPGAARRANAFPHGIIELVGTNASETVLIRVHCVLVLALVVEGRAMVRHRPVRGKPSLTGLVHFVEETFGFELEAELDTDRGRGLRVAIASVVASRTATLAP